MNSIKIAINQKTKLILKLEEHHKIEYYKESSFLQRLLNKDENIPDIYFHKGMLDKKSIDLIKKSKIVIVNAPEVKENILNKIDDISQDKIEVIYPYVNKNIAYNKEIKKDFKNRYDIEKKDKIILFTSKNLAKNGIKKFLEIVSGVSENNFIVIIESTYKEIEPLRLQMNRSKLNFTYMFLEDYKDKDELFIASDILIIPTKQKYFASNVLKAMYYKSAVFISDSNYAANILDTFSTIQGENDRSTQYKIDSLLLNKSELKYIQNTNYDMSLDYTLEKSFEKLEDIIKNKITV
ncbi:MAG: glycosyltransferase [Campylobacterota bacterium]|nr:glycosyltransferase [Campylobacterota bacterium]